MSHIINQPSYVRFVTNGQKITLPKNTSNISVDGNNLIRIRSNSQEYDIKITAANQIQSITDFGSDVPVPATISELYDIIALFFFKELDGQATVYSLFAENYTQLLAISENPQTLDIAYVRDAQGSKWLPGSVGGTYYPKGTYLYNGTTWVSDKSNVAEALDDVLYESDGFARYTDTVYTEIAPQIIPANQITVMENNANVIERHLPKGVLDYYNGTTFNYKGALINEVVSITTIFRAKPSAVNTKMDFGLGFGGDIIFERTLTFPKDAGVEAGFSPTFNSQVPVIIDTPFVLRPSSQVELYGMDFLIGRISKPRL